MFYKLHNKIDEALWRSLYVYYKESFGMVKMGDEISSMFRIEEGVKQGGKLSPYLFNFFLNELINECEESKVGAKIGKINIPLVGYCDDLVIVGPNAKHINQLLEICFKNAVKWKIKFNENKCNWMLAGRARIVKPVFKIHNYIITQVDSLIHLGIPFGNSA